MNASSSVRPAGLLPQCCGGALCDHPAVVDDGDPVGAALRRDEQVTVFFTTHYMEEAERVADRIAVIDHGRIVAEGTAAALRQQTGGRTLEDAFIALTGHSIREAEAAPVDRMRMMRQVWRGRR